MTRLFAAAMGAAIALVGLAGLAGCEPASPSVPGSPREICPVLPGATVPDVTVRDAQGKPVQLRDALGGKPAILVFYRGRWCRYCRRHLAELQRIHPELAKLRYRVFALSPDRPAEVAKTLDQVPVEFTLLSDQDLVAAKALGLAYRVDDQTLATLSGYGIDLADASGRDHRMLPVPAVVIVGADGQVRFVHADPDYRHRLPNSVLLSAARAFTYER